MSKLCKKLFTLIACAAIMYICMLPVNAQAATPKHIIKGAEKTTTVKADMTGDGTSNKITVTPAFGEYEVITGYKVKIDGATALTVTGLTESWCINVDYIKMGSNKIFLYITTVGMNDYYESKTVYRYKSSTRKLVPVLKLSESAAYEILSYDTTKGSITIQYDSQPNEVGMIGWKYTYLYKDGAFQLKSPTVNVKSRLGSYEYDEDGLRAKFAKNQFIVNRTSLKFYTKPGGSTVAFTAKKNKTLTMKKITKVGTKTYLSFSNGTTTGWIRIYHRDVFDWETTDPNRNGYFKGIVMRLAG